MKVLLLIVVAIVLIVLVLVSCTTQTAAPVPASPQIQPAPEPVMQPENPTEPSTASEMDIQTADDDFAAIDDALEVLG